MEFNNIAEGFELTVPSTVQTAFCDRTENAEIGQDFTLPDYQPEMRKLLRVSSVIQPPSRFLGIGEAEFSGNVIFTVLYIGGDGGLYTAELAAPYSFRIPMEERDRMVGDRPVELCADIFGETPSARLNAPRKLRINCRLRAHIVGYCDERTDAERIGEGGIPEKSEESRLCARLLFCMGEALELTEELTIPAGEGEPRLLMGEGSVRIGEATVTEGGIACRGELYLKLLMTRDPAFMEESEGTGNPQTEVLNCRIPFSQTVELPMSAAPGAQSAVAEGICTGVNARVEDGRILCAATIVLRARAIGSEKVTFVRDCFSTEYSTECTTRHYGYLRPIACLNSNVTAGGTVTAEEAGIPHGATPLDLTATARLTEISCEREHPVISGDCLYRLLYRTQEGEIGCGEVHLPLRYEMPGESRECGTAPVLQAHAVMLEGRARAESEGESYAIDAEWAVSLCLFAQEQAEAVEEIRFTDPYPRQKGTCVICYPVPGESLWDVAKRYHTPIRPLAARNSLPVATDPADPQSLEGVRFLMIS